MFSLGKKKLKNKILGGWTGKSYGAMMGQPMEFAAQGEIYQGSLDIHPESPKVWLHNEDDLYTNMAFLEVLRDKGLDASQEDFADVFRQSKFMLWHANGQARQNLLAGIPPNLAGHPQYNPHADDIDFQIECDFIGIISPGLSKSANLICDKVGHIMNYGDGYYAGAFLSSLYTYAYLDTNIPNIIRRALKSIPAQCSYAKIINDILDWYDKNPDDWRKTWEKLEDKWNFDLCPWAKSDPPSRQGGIIEKFNIQGHFNGAYILIGLLYGKGDYLEAIKICTRCGQDTDSNVANCGGIMGIITGYHDLPLITKNELAPYMDRDYNFTSLSIESASSLSYDLAIKNICQNGGYISGDHVHIKTQEHEFQGQHEISFIDFDFADIFTIHPHLSPELHFHGSWTIDETHKDLLTSDRAGDYVEVEFTGTCVYMQGNLHERFGILDVYIDDKLVQTRDMYTPSEYNNSVQSTAVWITNLPDAKHVLKVVATGRKRDESKGIGIQLGRVISYTGHVTELTKS